MNSHDPDFPQDIPAIPDAEAMTPPEGPPAEADPAVDHQVDDALPDSFEALSASSSALDAADRSANEFPMNNPPAAEVWTDLDESEPAAMAADPPRDIRPEAASWPSAMATGGGEERDEPDPSVLDAGSGSRREAEKPGRTVLPYDDWEPSEVPYQPKELGMIDQLMIVLADGAAIWRRGLRQVRSWLPITWQRTLSDELMTAIALGLVILWLVLWNPLGGGSTAGQGVEGPEISVSAPVLSPGGAQGGKASPLGESSASDPAITADNRAIDNRTEGLEPSPEQSLIADIQDRVSKISRSYGVGLIQSVEVNWPQQVLSVNVSNDWYGLGMASQDRIAQDIYTQAQGLALATLQLRDADGLVVARNPVVGPTMVILKRHRPTEGGTLG